MRQLALMASVFVTAVVGVVNVGAGPAVVVLVALWALASTALAVIFGIRRGEQVNRQPDPEAAGRSPVERPDALEVEQQPVGATPGPEPETEGPVPRRLPSQSPGRFWLRGVWRRHRTPSASVVRSDSHEP